MTTKMISNRLNSQRSTGPKTAVGKSRSRLNSTRHGFFSRAMAIPEKDRPAYERLRKCLLDDLQPATPVEQIAFENIMDCMWRRNLAWRFEGLLAAAHLDEQTQSVPVDGALDTVNSCTVSCFSASRSTLRISIRLVSQIEVELQDRGTLTDESRKTLTAFFGPDFIDLLDRWTPPMTKDALLAFSGWDHHLRAWGRPPSGDEPNGEPKALPEEVAPRVIIDPYQAVEMRAKLLSQRRQFLEELLKFSEQRWLRTASSLGSTSTRVTLPPPRRIYNALSIGSMTFANGAGRSLF